jgi:hypothetical protein
MLHKKQLELYVAAKEALAFAKATEMEQRIAICDEILEGKEKGTTTEVMFNIEIKAVKKFNLSLDKELLAQSLSDLSDEERECILMEPKLIAKEYQFLQEAEIDTPLLDECITVKDATPSLTINLPEDM